MTRWPNDPDAVALLAEWLLDPTRPFGANGVDLTGAALPGVPWEESWVLDCDLSGVDLRNAQLYRAHLQRSRFDRADLRGVELIKAEGSRASFRHARLDGGNLIRADLMNIDARGADLRRCDLGEVLFDNADLRGASLDECTLASTSFDGARLDGRTTVAGAIGAVFGPCLIEDRGEVDGPELAAWFAGRGATVEILQSPPRVTIADLP